MPKEDPETMKIKEEIKKLDLKITNVLKNMYEDKYEDNNFCKSLLNCKGYTFCSYNSVKAECLLNSSFDKSSEIYQIHSHGNELNEYFVIPPNVTIEVHSHGTNPLYYMNKKEKVKGINNYFVDFDDMENIIYNSKQIMRNIEFDFADIVELSKKKTVFYPFISEIDINDTNDYSV